MRSSMYKCPQNHATKNFSFRSLRPSDSVTLAQHPGIEYWGVRLYKYLLVTVLHFTRPSAFSFTVIYSVLCSLSSYFPDSLKGPLLPCFSCISHSFSFFPSFPSSSYQILFRTKISRSLAAGVSMCEYCPTNYP